MGMRSSDTSRWYGGLVAVVAGIYAIAMAAWGPGMSYADWFLLVVGGVVFGHGVALVGGFSRRLDATSGALLVGYALVLVLSQAWLGVRDDSPLQQGTLSSPSVHRELGWSTLPWDPGLVALAIVLLGSGVIMTAVRRR